jgi:methionyl-tRNA synthetase
MEKKSFYITTTLPYVNAPLHMGHALEFVRADTIARYKKLVGYDVFFNTGTDEHGIKIYEKAKENGLDAQAFVDQGFATFKEQLALFGVSDDVHFIRTTDKDHEASAQEFWRRVRDNGFIYKKNYQAKYCIGCESEKTDSDLNDEGYCPEHPGIALQIIEEENYFFKYSEFGEKLLAFYVQNPTFVIPEFRFNEMKAFVERGLQDFSISRLKSKMPWGIPVPDDEDHVMYVWFDALTNYINTLGWHRSAEALGEGDLGDLFQKYWVEGTPTQYCGKDNTRFQSAMWQAMLMAADFPNSHQIVVNGFITGDKGVKMSKTLGNTVDPRDIVAEYGTDALRYFLLREVSSFEDSPFTIERFKDAYNSGLANGIGNLTSRVLTLSEKYIDTFSPQEVLLESAVTDEVEEYNLQKAIDAVFTRAQKLDEYIALEKPFSVVKTDLEKGKKQIQHMVSELYAIAHHLTPFLPNTSAKIMELIKANKKPETPLFLRKD